MTEYVEYCENSTITEAWAVVHGTPGLVQDSEAGALENYASKKIGKFETKPSVVIFEVKDKDNAVPSFWRRQLSWNNDIHRCRIGHRYLSVHFLKQGDRKYETYEQSLKPQIEQWLNCYKETVSGQQEQYPIEKVLFGYINLFKFPGKDFDLSRYFKVNFATGLKSADAGLGNLDITFSVLNPSVTINVRVSPASPDLEAIIVTTRVEAQKIVEGVCSFENDDKLLELIGEMKNAAHSVFFDLATQETHDLMGAKYVKRTA
jgi:hypothetical protein